MVHNFNAGPSILPKEVFQQASESILNFDQTGLSILEFGHRTPKFTAVMEEARSLVKELMHLDSDHEVLFLHGGASTQFMQVPMNLLDTKETAAYTDTGVWASKALKEAKLLERLKLFALQKRRIIHISRMISRFRMMQNTCISQPTIRSMERNGRRYHPPAIH